LATLDPTDLKIIDILKRNARTPVLKMSGILGISDVAIKKRIKKMEDLGVIRGYTIKIDYPKLGYRGLAIVGLDVESSALLEVAKKLVEKDNVKYVAISTGDHMVIATIIAKDNEELAAFIDELRKMKGVTKVCPAIVLEILKDEL